MILVFLLGMFVLTLGVVMVLVSAFRKRFLWGAGIITLFPLAYPIYTALNWSEDRARNGFLVSIVGVSIVIASIYGGVAEMFRPVVEEIPNEDIQATVDHVIENVPKANPPSEPLPNATEAIQVVLPDGKNYDPLYEEVDLNVDIEPLPPREDQRVTVITQPLVPHAYQAIGFEELIENQGKIVKLSTTDGQQKEGKLIGSSRDTLILEMPYDQGTVSLEYRFENIAKLLIYKPISSDDKVTKNKIIPTLVENGMEESLPLPSSNEAELTPKVVERSNNDTMILGPGVVPSHTSVENIGIQAPTTASNEIHSAPVDRVDNDADAENKPQTNTAKMEKPQGVEKASGD